MKKKNWIVVALCVAIVGMGIGFAALAQNLQISATANITGEWDVKIIDIFHNQGNGGVTFVGNPTFDGTSGTFEFDLAYPGAWADFAVTIRNDGNIPAMLSSITGIDTANSQVPSEIRFSVVDFSSPPVGWVLPVDSQNNWNIRVEWVVEDGIESVMPDEKNKAATISFNFVQAT